MWSVSIYFNRTPAPIVGQLTVYPSHDWNNQILVAIILSWHVADELLPFGSPRDPQCLEPFTETA